MDPADSSAELLKNLKVRCRVPLGVHNPLTVFDRCRTPEVTGTSWTIYLMVRYLAPPLTPLTASSSATNGANSAGFSYIRVPLGATDFSANSKAFTVCSTDERTNSE